MILSAMYRMNCGKLSVLPLLKFVCIDNEKTTNFTFLKIGSKLDALKKIYM